MTAVDVEDAAQTREDAGRNADRAAQRAAPEGEAPGAGPANALSVSERLERLAQDAARATETPSAEEATAQDATAQDATAQDTAAKDEAVGAPAADDASGQRATARQADGPDAAPEASIDGGAKAAPSEATGATVTLGWVLDQLGERAFGLFLLVLALPCAVPFLYGIPQVVAFPLLFVTTQLVMGRRAPWLPERLASRKVSAASLAELSRRAGPWLRFLETFLRPRLSVLSRPPLDRVVGVLLVIFSLSIMVPLPLTNTVPGIAVALVALGFLERDGLAVAAGALLGSAWVAFLIYVAIFIPAKLFGG